MSSSSMMVWVRRILFVFTGMVVLGVTQTSAVVAIRTPGAKAMPGTPSTAFKAMPMTIHAGTATTVNSPTPAIPAPAVSLNLKPIGQVVWVKGDVEAAQFGKTMRALQRRSVIYANDVIVTGMNASGEVVFTDSSIVTLRGGTQLKIDKYQFDPKTPQDNKYIASLAKGGFRTITGLISKGHPENYQVNTPVATIGVRGTIYTIVLTGMTLSIEINQGAIVAVNQAGSYEMTKGKGLPFSSITGINGQAVPSATQPAALQGQPETTPATAPTPKSLQSAAQLQQATTPGAMGTTTTTTTGGTTTTTGGSTSTTTTTSGTSTVGGGTSSGGGGGTTGGSSGTSTVGGSSGTSTVGGSSSSGGTTGGSSGTSTVSGGSSGTSSVGSSSSGGTSSGTSGTSSVGGSSTGTTGTTGGTSSNFCIGG